MQLVPATPPEPIITRLDRIAEAISPKWAASRVLSRFALHNFAYDGARATTRRAQAPSNINPNDFSKQRDRLQLLREAEDLENNFAPAKTINRKYAMYVAPTSYHAQTGDSKLDRDVEDWLNAEWFPNCDITGRWDFFSMMAFGVLGMNRGGDYGWAFMRPGYDERMSLEDVSGLPFRIQGVEPDRLGGVYQNVVQENYIAGITLGRYGEPVSYRVFRRSPTVGQYTDPVDVIAANFVHYTDPMRIDMYRGVSKLDAATVHLRDLMETLEFLKAKQKLASALTLFTGSTGAQIPGSGGGGMNPYAATLPNGQAATQQDIMYGQINHLVAGQDIKFPDTAAPGIESQYLCQKLLELTAMSYNLPYSFALDASALGGVSARLESEQAKGEFNRGQKVLARHASRIKDAALLDAMAKGDFPASVGRKIFKGRWGYRAHPQPDIGKEASAAIMQWQNGLLDPLAHFVEQGQDPEDVARNMVRWAVAKQDAADEAGIELRDAFGPGPSLPASISVSTTKSIDVPESNSKKTSTETLTSADA
jgi:capsid protein